MRFESVTAHDFGPFHERTLDLVPGMNVVYGSNEAGKSSWHAALYAGFCGMRRGKGQPLKDDREFAERHRPWDGPVAWEVGVIVELADGRRVELRHDLAGKVDCSAQDADLAGRDYVSQILFDGSPDGSRWLGLNRKSFRSTACIGQADMFRVLGDAGALQQDMQRAAATAGTDATAAEALTRLGEYRAEHVGSRRAPTKPLRVSEGKAAEANVALEGARARHGEYMEHRARVEGLERRARDAQLQADAVRTALAAVEADAFDDRLQRVRELDARFPDGAPHPSPARDALASRVASALTSWKNRPGLADLIGPTAEEIDGMIAESEVELGAARATVAEREAEEAERRLNHIRNRQTETLRHLRETAVACGSKATEPEVQAQELREWQEQRKLDTREREELSSQWDELQQLQGGQSLDAITEQTNRLRAEACALVASADHALLESFRGRSITREHLSAMEQAVNAKRVEWEGDRRDRLAAERQHEEDERVSANAQDALRGAAASAGVTADDDDGLAAALEHWQEDRKNDIARAEQLGRDWDELQRRRGDRSLDEMESEAVRLRNNAATRASEVGDAALANARREQPREETLTALQDKADAAHRNFRDERVRLEGFANTLRSVADAEEALDVVLREQERVAVLDQTLGSTIDFLEQAQKQIQRNIAPILSSTVLEWLPSVTGGRYEDCRIDPESLLVEVRGPNGWYRAQLLSHGTAEQVYLLLRLALSRHLTKEGEICPLILDDVVSASDAARKRVVLETLLAISESTQVVLFTHEDDVRDWADERLEDPHGRLIEIRLDPVTV